MPGEALLKPDEAPHPRPFYTPIADMNGTFVPEPDFRGLHLLEAIQAYQQRERRFGGLGEGSDEELADTLPAGEAALARS